ncbi:collagen-like repeat preface domain-containing protein [Bacillus sp. GB_SG_008]|uniref:collagen-like repeat preface domain-containing protein n=1 Tax=Bacillus sp. GB_SG_008 TaxID=3454627 RepID=UPI003F85B05A
MSYFKANQKKISKPYFPKQSDRLPAVHYTPAPESYGNLFSKTLNDLTAIIPTAFSNPSQSNMKKLINILEILKGGLKRLNLTLTQQETGIAIVENLITILNEKPFAANTVYIELQNLLNFSLHITKLSMMNHHGFENIIEQTEELQITLLQITPIGMNGQFQGNHELLDELNLQGKLELLDEQELSEELRLQDGLELLDEQELSEELGLQDGLELLDEQELSEELGLQDGLELLDEQELSEELGLQDGLELLDEQELSEELGLQDGLELLGK